ncbi:acyl carrier protein [Enterorhabdus sp. P55]|jgi:acyl carrier protein|uniref:acyl carrier protein n=1 Tax=Enterorhabdus sp. P55 TaxID=2304571 RepID=UPI0013717386|nr:acyl carrier protein [Enterorhabdus sp. P55]MCI8452463.1 acyl carrier protein [Eggerthellaceae bacterium]NBI32668.1 acyl carrier protein [Enterorhabdus sp. P55]
MATIDTVRDILQRNLEIDPAAVTEESTFESLGIDSLDMVELICDLEDELGIDFGEPEGLTTTADLVAYIDAL